MSQDIKINSEKWCDIVFENKNKNYGAYKLRQTSSKRHLIAFIICILFMGTIVAVPSLLKAVNTGDIELHGYTGATVMTNVATEDKEEDVVIPPKEVEPPAPLIAKTIAFSPPVIVTEVTGTEMADQGALQDPNAGKIGNFTFTAGSLDPNAVTPDMFQNNAKVTGNTGGSDNTVYPNVGLAQEAAFPGGEAELFRFLGKNIKYPVSAIDNLIEGKVVLTFVVEKDGSISSVEIAKSLDPACDREAVRVIKSMPNWIPGKQNGKAVRVQYILPVSYTIQR